ncbi:MAG: hypothetical protein A2836_03025 [Candidatus Taylorbacteria bacterium RIFCSPHIGHO2_01_FULL_45_63]|nr:MAG: hypothetical protein A2836_03025 [Candidatus Taylorbacteria bacterium RIFCSPHIGHO2_01_FULL_45_63]
MKTYSMTCRCGDVMKVEAESRNEAVAKLKARMTLDEVKRHMDEKHPGEPLSSQEQIAMEIEKGVVEV